MISCLKLLKVQTEAVAIVWRQDVLSIPNALHEWLLGTESFWGETECVCMFFGTSCLPRFEIRLREIRSEADGQPGVFEKLMNLQLFH